MSAFGGVDVLCYRTRDRQSLTVTFADQMLYIFRQKCAFSKLSATRTYMRDKLRNQTSGNYYTLSLYGSRRRLILYLRAQRAVGPTDVELCLVSILCTCPLLGRTWHWLIFPSEHR